jgi:hypothetical protein
MKDSTGEGLVRDGIDEWIGELKIGEPITGKSSRYETSTGEKEPESDIIKLRGLWSRILYLGAFRRNRVFLRVWNADREVRCVLSSRDTRLRQT